MKKIALIALVLVLTVGMVFAGGSSEKSDDDTVTLTWWQVGGQPRNLDAALKIMNEYTKEKINVEIDLKFTDWSVRNAKVTAMVNAGDEWDILFTDSGFYSAHVAQGAYADITESIKTGAPALYKFIPEKIWQGVEVGGKIYGVPTYKDSAKTQYWIWDKELAEKYDLDTKNLITLADLDPVLREMQMGEYPNGKGYILEIPQGGIHSLISARYDEPSVLTDVVGVRFDDDTLTVVNILEQNDIMNDLKIIHEWYKDGLIPVDAATTIFSSATQFERLPIVSAQAFPGSEVSYAIGRDGHEVIMQEWSDTVISTGTILGSVNAISATSPYQEEALKYLELINLDPKLRNMYAYGIEGENFKYNDDGTITRLDDVWLIPFFSQATFFTMSPIAPNSVTQWTMVQEQMNEAIPSVLLGFSFDARPVENEIANCKSILERYQFDLFTGTADPTKLVPIIYAEMKKVGYDAIVTEMQAQVNAWASK